MYFIIEYKNNFMEKIEKIKNNNIIDEKIYYNIKNVLIKSHNHILKTINSEMVNAYWNIGKYIFEAQGEKERAEYGIKLVEYLSEKLTNEFGKGFSKRNLFDMRLFYQTIPIVQTLSAQLSWSHIRLILSVSNEKKRNFYIKECAECNWSVRQLERQINTFYYERLLSSQHKDIVRNEIQMLEPNKLNTLDILKDPYILEFLNLKEKSDFLEKDLESDIMNHLQSFILEMGKGFSFVGRQYRISIDGEHYYIDLVFYNIILKCYVLVDLKRGKLNHKDIGQMDFYVRYFEKEIKGKENNPTIGMILCSEKSGAMVKYTMLEDSKQIFAAKYTTILPSEIELTEYITKERELLERQYLKIQNINDPKEN